MSQYLLFRPTDHLVIGVSWQDMTVTGTPPGITAVGAHARLIVTFPPQHVGEQCSAEGEDAPLRLASGNGTVPGWSGTLSGQTTIAVAPPPGSTVALTVEGVLTALREHSIAADDTGVELPWGLVLAPSGTASCVHATAPDAHAAAHSIWRTRVTPTGDPGGTLPVRALRAADGPGFDIPLREPDRRQLVIQTAVSPARASRLELSTLGGTLDVLGTWSDYEWEQHTVLGRDMGVRLLARGRLYPFGHRAQVLEVTSRVYDDVEGSVAVLRKHAVLTVTEPVRESPAEGPARVRFPFRGVELTTRSYADLVPPAWTDFGFADGRTIPTYFWPTRQGPPGGRVQFPVTARTASGAVQFAVPLLFVKDLVSLGIDTTTDPRLARALAGEYGEQATELPAATPIDLTGGAGHGSGDVHEVHAFTVAAIPPEFAADNGFRPALAGMQVRLPELRTLLNEAEHTLHSVRYAEDYLRGATKDVMLAVDDAIDVNFTKLADRAGALVAPQYVADAISRTCGPVNLGALPNADGVIGDITKLFGPDANILGYPLRELLGLGNKAPKIVSDVLEGRAPQVTMKWEQVPLGRRPSAAPGAPPSTADGFVIKPGAMLDLTVDVGPVRNETTCLLTGFGLQFPPRDPVLRLTFATLRYSQSNGQPPNLDVGHVDVEFLGDLTFVEDLKKAIDLGSAAKFVDVTSKAIAVKYGYTAPPIPFGAFVMRDIAMRTSLTVPYDGPTTLALGLSSRANPFQLSVMTFGGSGYAELELGIDGIRRIEAALEFGAMMSVDFIVARGEVHVLGGVRFVLRPNGSVMVSGYLRMGGSVSILGLISVSIELMLELSYDSETNALVGRATLVIELDLTLWSDTVELDTGTWVLAGGGHRDRMHFLDAPADVGEEVRDRRESIERSDPYDDPRFACWLQYRRCFAGSAPS